MPKWCHAGRPAAIALDRPAGICHTFAAMKLSHPGGFRARWLLSAARLLALLLLVLTALEGCASREKGFNDEFADQAGHLRNNKTAGQKLGLSARSQQIESDLGVR
jgi:hypothetical protein